MQLPLGSQDDMGTPVNRRLRINEVFREISIKRGFNEISTPVIEYANTFTNPFVGMNLKTMLKWFDSEGEIQVLRPDWTIAIARALSNEHSDRKKWAYQGSVFRTNVPGTEFRQVGVEIVDTDPILGEYECLALAIHFLQALKTDTYYIELGHTGVFEALTATMNLTVEVIEQLRQAMHDKNKDEVYRISRQYSTEAHAREITQLVEAFGTTDILDEYERRWHDKPELMKSIQHLKQVVNILKTNQSPEVLIDLGRVKNQPYYSGIMFRGFTKQKGTTLFSGGRYDHLYNQFSQTRTAVGLAFDVDALSQHIGQSSKQERICVVASMQTLKLAEKLRKTYDASIVDIQFEEPDNNNYDKVIQIIESNGKYEVVER